MMMMLNVRETVSSIKKCPLISNICIIVIVSQYKKKIEWNIIACSIELLLLSPKNLQVEHANFFKVLEKKMKKKLLFFYFGYE